MYVSQTSELDRNLNYRIQNIHYGVDCVEYREYWISENPCVVEQEYLYSIVEQPEPIL